MRIDFFTREFVLTSRGGAATYVMHLIEALRSRNYKVHMHVTVGLTPNRKPITRLRYPRHSVDGLHVPGFVMVGNWALQVNSPMAIVFAGLHVIHKLSAKLPLLESLLRFLYDVVPALKWQHANWNLNLATEAEKRYLLRATAAETDNVILANYFFFGPAFCAAELRQKQKAILMHSLLSRRERDILEAGFELDSVSVCENEELSCLRQADVVIAIQKSEAEYVQARCPEVQCVTIPDFVHVRSAACRQIPGRCLFVGSRIVPNTSGIRHFIRHVWPLILRRVPSATLHVCGAVCSDLETDVPGVVLRGFVENLSREYEEAEVCVLPLLAGSGLKIKLVEALAHGRACVSTSVGVQGVENLVDNSVLVANEANKFAQAVLNTLQDADLRRKMEQAAFEIVLRHFSEESAADQLDLLLGSRLNSNRAFSL